MMPKAIWNFWASRYERLWAQRFVLKPARDMVITHIERSVPHPVRILDIGCGVGQLARELAEHFPLCQVTAIDTSAEMIEHARRRNAHSRVEFHADSIDTSVSYGQFDVITMTNAFPYLPDKSDALARLRTLLNPEGRLLLTHATMENAYDALFLIPVRFTVSRGQYLSVRKLSALMMKNGFTIGTVRPLQRAFFIPSIYLFEGIRA